jgi:hypothetical protein
MIESIAHLEALLRSLLQEELGVFSNQEVAIWRGSIIPTDLKTNGLQCIVQPVKEGEIISLGLGQKFADQHWIVELINFCTDSRNPDYIKLATAKRKLEQAFYLTRTPIYQAPTDLRLERCVFHLYSPFIYNP